MSAFRQAWQAREILPAQGSRDACNRCGKDFQVLISDGENRDLRNVRDGPEKRRKCGAPIMHGKRLPVEGVGQIGKASVYVSRRLGTTPRVMKSRSSLGLLASLLLLFLLSLPAFFE